MTTAVVTLGVHMETTPLEWPSCMTPFQGFWRIVSHVPIFVLCCAMICPVLVSYMYPKESQSGRNKDLHSNIERLIGIATI